jgi:hypothetical protein
VEFGDIELELWCGAIGGGGSGRGLGGVGSRRRGGSCLLVGHCVVSCVVLLLHVMRVVVGRGSIHLIYVES